MFIDAVDLERTQAWLRLTNGQLAERAGMPVKRLCKLRSGRKRISSDDRKRLSKALADRLSELRNEGKGGDDDDLGRSGGTGTGAEPLVATPVGA